MTRRPNCCTCLKIEKCFKFLGTDSFFLKRKKIYFFVFFLFFPSHPPSMRFPLLTSLVTLKISVPSLPSAEVSFSPDFTAVTGETGTGKTRILRALDWTRGKGEGVGRVESIWRVNDDEGGGELPHVNNIINCTVVRSMSSSNRIRSRRYLNGEKVTKGSMSGVSGRLYGFAVVDGGKLDDGKWRVGFVDGIVDGKLKDDASRMYDEYYKARVERIRNDRRRRSADGLTIGVDDDVVEHWRDEIDEFAERVREFRRVAIGDVTGVYQSSKSSSKPSWSSKGPNKDKEEADDDDEYDDDGWTNCGVAYRKVQDYKAGVDDWSSRIVKARMAREEVDGLGPGGVFESCRGMLYDVVEGYVEDEDYEEEEDGGGGGGGDFEGGDGASRRRIARLSEASHAILNDMEEAAASYSSSVDDLLSSLESSRPAWTAEEAEAVASEWASLSSKHSCKPWELREIRESLEEKLTGEGRGGEDERREEECRVRYEEACGRLSEGRRLAAAKVQGLVMDSLGSLSMSGKKFKIVVSDRPGLERGGGGDDVDDGDGDKYDDSSVALGKIWGGKKNSKDEPPGIDEVQFYFVTDDGESLPVSKSASGGEKTRLLLLFDTLLPDAAAAAASSSSSSSSSGSRDGDVTSIAPRPSTIIYDEIDAHVGGRAATSVARLLLSQGLLPGRQVISITHSASVASHATEHVVVEGGETGSVKEVRGEDRVREIARMAGGEIGDGRDGVTFAKALIREGKIKIKADSARF